MTDPRTPEQYRGISKLFTSIINNRLTRYLEDINLYADEQNGFRGDRNCIDHIFSLTSIIKNRKNRGLSTYIAYIDGDCLYPTLFGIFINEVINNCGAGIPINEGSVSIQKQLDALHKWCADWRMKINVKQEHTR